MLGLIEEEPGIGGGGREGRIHRLLKVTVLEIAGAKVKLGFETDCEVPVHRWEVWERIIRGRARPSRCRPAERQCR